MQNVFAKSCKSGSLVLNFDFHSPKSMYWVLDLLPGAVLNFFVKVSACISRLKGFIQWLLSQLTFGCLNLFYLDELGHPNCELRNLTIGYGDIRVVSARDPGETLSGFLRYKK